MALGSTQMVQDPAGKVYDLDTFGPKRYEHPMLNSYGHAVPLPDGTLQSDGKKFAARIAGTSFSDARDEIVLDLKGAYKSANILKLERRMVYDRANGTVTVDKVQDYDLAMIVVDGDDFLVSGTATGKSYLDNPDDGSAAGFTAAKMGAGSWATYTPASTPTPPTPDIPEPTSGLLLLVGGAMLALRRKQK